MIVKSYKHISFHIIHFLVLQSYCIWRIGTEKAQTLPYSLPGLALPQIHYGEVCALCTYSFVDLVCSFYLSLRCKFGRENEQSKFVNLTKHAVKIHRILQFSHIRPRKSQKSDGFVHYLAFDTQFRLRYLAKGAAGRWATTKFSVGRGLYAPYRGSLGTSHLYFSK